MLSLLLSNDTFTGSSTGNSYQMLRWFVHSGNAQWINTPGVIIYIVDKTSKYHFPSCTF